VASSPRAARTYPLPRVGAARAGPGALLWRLQALLELRPDDLLVQLGCAFPDHLVALTEVVPLRYQPVVIDPSPKRLAPFSSQPKLRSVVMDPLRFAAYPMQCDRLLVEDSLLQEGRSAELAKRLYGRLYPQGRLVAVGAESPPPRARTGRICVVLEDAGFEVRRDAAHLGSGRIDLVLGVKPATS
jgi:hypothetical protein